MVGNKTETNMPEPEPEPESGCDAFKLTDIRRFVDLDDFSEIKVPRDDRHLPNKR